MSIYAILIDSQNAKVFAFAGGEVTHHAYHRHEPAHHTGHTVDAEKNSEHFFHEVATHLTGATQLLLMGPGLGKEHFKSHLEKHHAHDLAQKIVAVDTVDHPTDPQLVAHAREVFAAHHIDL
jgi:stalled ribosome rescue protein Dom34